MRFTETELKDAFVLDLERRADERGFFARAFCEKEFAEHRLETRFVQCNISFNERKGTLRGLHYQVAPHVETKLVRCFRGAIYDVIIDLRPDSPTYRRWLGVELSEDDRRMLYVPEGFAHGYQTLADATEAFYHVSAFYAPGEERGVRWNDPAFEIEWPEPEPTVISDKDATWPNFAP